MVGSVAFNMPSAGFDQDPSIVLSELTSGKHGVIQLDRRRPFRPEKHPADECICVVSGLLAKFRTSASGRRLILGLSLRSDVILPHMGLRLYGLQALTPTEVVVVGKTEMDRLASKSERLRQRLWGRIVREEAINQEKIAILASHDAKAKVAHLLCELRERGGLTVQGENPVLPLTQQQIAEITGQTNVNVNRVLSELDRDGYIKRVGPRLHVVDWPGLIRLASFDPCYLNAPESALE